MNGFDDSRAFDINDAQQVVGLVRNSNQGSLSDRAFLWQHGEFHDLNKLGASDFEPTLKAGGSINDAGQIVVHVSARSALLTPIDVPIGDLNYDCRVDVYDLLILLEQWGPVPRGAAAGKESATPSADLNGDGVVNVLDLLILLENWTF